MGYFEGKNCFKRLCFTLFVFMLFSGFIYPQYTNLTSSSVELACFTLDPTTGIVYAQDDGNTGGGTDYFSYNPSTGIWSTLAACPLNSGNNGGGVYWNGRIYTIYTGNSSQMGVYDIASNSWTTITNGLGQGTGCITTDGTYIYAVRGNTFRRFDPATGVWSDLANSSISFQSWGGLAYYNGWIYGHEGNGNTGFAKYQVATNTWTTLTDVPGGAVLGSDIDPVGKIYYCTGSYGGNNMYMFNLETETWSTESLPWTPTDDGGMAYSCLSGIQGMYVSQGQAGTGFARRTTPAGCGCNVANPGGPYTVYTTQSVTLDGSASTGASTYYWDIDNDGVYGDVTGVSPTLSWAQLNSFGISSVGSYPIGLQIADSTGCLTEGSGVLQVENCTVCCIVANASNQTMYEGQSVTLNGSASTGAVNYRWDLNNDGTYGDVTGANPVVSWATLNSFGINSTGTYVIGLEIDDGTPSCTKSDMATLTVNTPVSAPPEVSTQAVTNISASAATGNGNLVNLGYPNPTSHGVCWNTSGTPTISNSRTNSGSASSTGPFTGSISGLASGTTYYVRAYATNSQGTAYGAQVSFTTTASPPSATTNAATGISSTGATINGTVNANGMSTTVSFQYGTTASYGSTATASPGTVSGTSNTSVSGALSGLLPNTTYHYRVVATNATGTTNGSDQTFTTSALAPVATTNAATGINSTGAVLNGSVRANNQSTNVTFEYGTTASYGSTATAYPTTLTGMTDTSVSGTLTGLLPNTTYHYRVVATNATGTTHGSDMTFSTSGSNPVTVTESATDISSTASTLNGSVIANNQDASVSFEYGKTASYGLTVTADPALTTGMTDTAVLSRITGLEANTTYHYRVVATNATGTSYGADMTFTSLTAPPVAVSSGATGINVNSAKINGTVRANNLNTNVVFEWGGTAACSNTVSSLPALIRGNYNTEVSHTLTGLLPNTVYYYRVRAENGAGTTRGECLTFTTSGGAPVAQTFSAVSVTETSAVLRGRVNPNNILTQVAFNYGTDTTYSSEIAAQPAEINGLDDKDVSVTLTGLTSDTTYYFRVWAKNSAGQAYGYDMSFTTGAGLPEVETVEITHSSSVVKNTGGKVISDGGSVVTSRGVCFSKKLNPTLSDFHTDNGAGSGDFTAQIRVLEPESNYFVRAYATNKIGTSYGRNVTFKTPESSSMIIITDPLADSFVSSTVMIEAESYGSAGQIAFYIDDEFLGNGRLKQEDGTGSKYLVFNAGNSDYMYINSKKTLMKITKQGHREPVFNRDIRVDDIRVSDAGMFEVDFAGDILLNKSEICRSLVINPKTGEGFSNGMNMEIIRDNTLFTKEFKNNFSEKIFLGSRNILAAFDTGSDETVSIAYNKKSRNYSIFSTDRDENKTLLFLRERPLKAVKNSALSVKSVKLSVEDYKDGAGTESDTYEIEWNTLDHIDGLHDVEIRPVNDSSDILYDIIKVNVRNFMVKLQAERREDRALTFPVHTGEIRINVINPGSREAAKYRVLRAADAGGFEVLKEISSEELGNGEYLFYDNNINRDIYYTYKVEALDASGNVLTESEWKSI